MPWTCTSHEEGPPSICSSDMGSAWEEGQRQTAGYLEMDNEMEEAGKTWNELWWLARDRPTRGANFFDALCSIGSEEDWVGNMKQPHTENAMLYTVYND